MELLLSYVNWGSIFLFFSRQGYLIVSLLLLNVGNFPLLNNVVIVLNYLSVWSLGYLNLIALAHLSVLPTTTNHTMLNTITLYEGIVSRKQVSPRSSSRESWLILPSIFINNLDKTLKIYYSLNFMLIKVKLASFKNKTSKPDHNIIPH